MGSQPCGACPRLQQQDGSHRARTRGDGDVRKDRMGTSWRPEVPPINRHCVDTHGPPLDCRRTQSLRLGEGGRARLPHWVFGVCLCLSLNSSVPQFPHFPDGEEGNFCAEKSHSLCSPTPPHCPSCSSSLNLSAPRDKARA